MSDRKLTRRDFLRASGAAALVATAVGPLLGQESQGKGVRVVLIRHQNVVGADGKLDRKVLEGMLDEAVVAVFGSKSAEEAWGRVITASDVVGIKTNAWEPLRTPMEMEEAITKRVLATGVKPDDVSVDDRRVLSNAVFKRSTALINIRPMRAHAWSGVGSCLKNYIMFSSNPSDYHPDSCVDLGALWKLPMVKGKTRLNILVMLTPQFHCVAPHHFEKEYTWAYRGLLVGTDPVAVDAVGLKVIEAKRRLYFKEETPMRPPAKHIAAADWKHGIGISDMKKIDFVRLGWKEGSLI
jgi:hypothetical protein